MSRIKLEDRHHDYSDDVLVGHSVEKDVAEFDAA
jgi:hypothetical protein